jgi:glycine dehydrogenase subunit 1
MALFVTVYLSLMGPEGMKRVNDLSYGGAHYLHEELLKTGKFSEAFNRPFLNEFTLKSKVPVDKLQKAFLDAGIFAALQIEGDLVSFCVTEKRTREEIDLLVKIAKEA